MLKLDTKLKINAEVIKSPNLADRFSKEDQARIANQVYDGYQRDKQSRFAWERRNESGMDLAMQLQKDKNFPWPDCSNVAFPLTTIAALQFHALAYPTIVQGPEIVKCRVIGDDPDGSKKARADRIGCYMSYQVMEEDSAWEEQFDRLLINLPIVGCAFKKSYYSGTRGHNVSELVLARDLVMNYFATSVEACSRKTHSVPFFRNEIYERVQEGLFLDILDEAWFGQPPRMQQTQQQTSADKRTGVVPPLQPDQDTPFPGLEQHCLLDLDGDGYAEPYVVTIEETSKTLLRIVTRFDREEDVVRRTNKDIVHIRSTEYFTKYSFIPSPDGGIYDLGFGVLLGPLNESVNTLINQLIDAGTWATTAGGFLGRGAKVRGGVYSFKPLEWKRVDATGDDLRKSIVPLEAREPSAVLFNLLSLLINYTQRISGTTDMMVGETPGQNTPAETTRAVMEQGRKIYTSVFKRVWRSAKEEFKKLYILNAAYLPDSKTFSYGGKAQKAIRQDYLGNPEHVVPVADPNISSDQARVQQAAAIAERALAVPGYNPVEVERNFLKALRVEGIDVLYPGPDKVPAGKNPKVAIEEMKTQVKMTELQQARAEFAAELIEEQRVNNAKITKLMAEAAKIAEEAKTEGAYAQAALVNAQIAAAKTRDEALRKRIELLLKAMEIDDERKANRTGISGVAAASSDEGGENVGAEAEAGA